VTRQEKKRGVITLRRPYGVVHCRIRPPVTREEPEGRDEGREEEKKINSTSIHLCPWISPPLLASLFRPTYHQLYSPPNNPIQPHQDVRLRLLVRPLLQLRWLRHPQEINTFPTRPHTMSRSG
jgi:hypothetical protein